MIENKRIETAEQSAAEEQIQAEITFREELIEEAVRKELGLSKTDKITASMLENVRKLRIVGKEILDDEDTFWGEGHHVDGKDSSFGFCARKYYRSFGSGTNGKSGGTCAV